MRQLVILSGKGGTGKTTVASAFIKLSKAKAFADCDVDAPNLHLIYKNKPTDNIDYFGMDKAYIDPNKCIHCGQCIKSCNFDAIEQGEVYKINPYDCEGCGVCQLVCPVGAIEFKKTKAGDIMLSKDENIVFSTAKLKMGNGTSGKLVSEVKKRLKDNVEKDCFAVIDGSPGIGCPVIATLSGADTVLIVAEPSISGISDLKRIVKTAKGFGIKIAVCINKYDINLDNTQKIEEYSKGNNLCFVGKIPYDKEAVNFINLGKTIVDGDSISGTAVKEIYKNTINFMYGDI